MVELIWEEHGVVRRLSGLVTNEELDSSAQQLQGNERVDDLCYVIHDFSACTDIQVRHIDIQFMAVRASAALMRNRKVRIAFVGNHPVIHALIDTFNTKGISAHRCHRFDTMDEARAFTQGRC